MMNSIGTSFYVPQSKVAFYRDNKMLCLIEPTSLEKSFISETADRIIEKKEYLYRVTPLHPFSFGETICLTRKLAALHGLTKEGLSQSKHYSSAFFFYVEEAPTEGYFHVECKNTFTVEDLGLSDKFTKVDEETIKLLALVKDQNGEFCSMHLFLSGLKFDAVRDSKGASHIRIKG